MKKSDHSFPGFEDEKDLPPDYPVRADLINVMKIDIAVNKDARVLALHDRPFPELLQWVEYDPVSKRLFFVTRNGNMHDFGEEIEPIVARMLDKADYIETCQYVDGQVRDYGRYRLVKMQTIH